MRSICALLICSILLSNLAGCGLEATTVIKTRAATKREYPTVNIPRGHRYWNWPGSEGGGSCVHAAAVMLFHWQGRHSKARYWRRTYQNGDTPDRYVGDPRCNLADKLEREGVRYAYTAMKGDVSFLQWACDTHRGCGVTVMGGQHMVVLVHLDEKWAGILDSNQINKIIWVPRETFIAEWLASNSWAWTPVYTPAPPLPIK